MSVIAAAPPARRAIPLPLIILCGCIIAAIGFGTRGTPSPS